MPRIDLTKLIAGLHEVSAGVFEHRWLKISGAGAVHILDAGLAPSSYFDLVTTEVAPLSGVATYPLATGVKAIEYKSLSEVPAEYCLLGFGVGFTDAEASRDAGQVIIKAGEIGSERVPELASHVSIKSIFGNPVVQFQQKG